MLTYTDMLSPKSKILDEKFEDFTVAYGVFQMSEKKPITCNMQWQVGFRKKRDLVLLNWV